MGLGTQFLRPEVKTKWEKPNSCSCGLCCEPQLFISELPLKPEDNVGEPSRLHLQRYSNNLLPPIVIISRESWDGNQTEVPYLMEFSMKWRGKSKLISFLNFPFYLLFLSFHHACPSCSFSHPFKSALCPWNLFFYPHQNKIKFKREQKGRKWRKKNQSPGASCSMTR